MAAGCPPAVTSSAARTGAGGDDQPSTSVGPSQNTTTTARVRIQVLGPPTIHGVPVDYRPRRHALEFLTYLVVRGGSVWQHEVFEDLMPEPTRRKAAQRLHTYTYDLREAFKLVGSEGTRLRLRKHRYTLVEEVFDVDLWLMRDAIRAAATAADSEARVAALRRAVDAYVGPLAANTGYLWVAAYREAVRSEYVNAAVSLADELADLGDAAAVLAKAREVHPDDLDLAAAAALLQERSA